MIIMIMISIRFCECMRMGFEERGKFALSLLNLSRIMIIISSSMVLMVVVKLIMTATSLSSPSPGQEPALMQKGENRNACWNDDSKQKGQEPGQGNGQVMHKDWRLYDRSRRINHHHFVVGHDPSTTTCRSMRCRGLGKEKVLMLLRLLLLREARNTRGILQEGGPNLFERCVWILQGISQCCRGGCRCRSTCRSPSTTIVDVSDSVTIIVHVAQRNQNGIQRSQWSQAKEYHDQGNETQSRQGSRHDETIQRDADTTVCCRMEMMSIMHRVN
jgi:hypothetical protein